MDTIGLDLHKRESQLCIVSNDGELIERRIVTSRARFTEILGSRPPARILLEASTESEWVARHLESLGHTVIVADPGFAPMYATRSKRVKTDKHIRAELAVRDALVRTRTRYVAIINAFVRREGLRLASGEVEQVVAKLAQLALPSETTQQLAPLVALLVPINVEIAAADARLIVYGNENLVVRRLRTMPGIGPVTALAFVAALDDVTRFQNAHQVQAYLGLVPSEYSSGERQMRGRITKRGDARMRWLLVEAGWRILRSPNPDLATLKSWAEQIAARRGKRIAVVAIARRLAGILYAMWRDGTEYRSRPAERAA
jgi:transposase